MRRSTVLLLVGLCLSPAAARAERFRYQYRPGQVVRSRASVAGASMMGPRGESMLKMQFRTVLRHTARVRSAAGGVVTLEVTEVPVSGSMTAFGQTERHGQQPPRVSVVRMTERGRFLSRKAASAEPGGGVGLPGLEAAEALYGLAFPDRDLKPGDTWEETVTVGEGAERRQVRMTSRFVARELFRGRRCARINTTLSMPIRGSAEDGPPGPMPPAQGRLTAVVTTYFDPAMGVEVYSSGSVTVVARADLSEVSPEGGEFVTVSKINLIQSLLPVAARKK